MNNAEWHEDQSLAFKNEQEAKAKKEAERDEILNTYKWIKVPKYYEKDPNDLSIDWKKAYQELMEHHNNETTFLINKVRSLVK